ncbi:MAG: hypothetical protein INR73_24505 [Williamsia sp.]|nr:hypothetical protein [Williamsia sp.]
MNFLNKLLLRLVLMPALLYKKLGADPRQLRLILTAKLMMDDRRPNMYHYTRRKTEKAISGSTLGTMFFSLLFGLFFLYGFMISDERITQLTIYFSIYIVILSTTLISDFTSVLMDVRDNYIILPKPVNDKTFVLCRLLHIFIHLLKLVIPMSLPAVVYMFIQQGPGASLVFSFILLFCTVFTIFLINAVYLIILKVSTPAKFQAIISYVQIFIAIFMYVGYQLVPRLANKIMLTGYTISGKPWAWLLPSYWFAGGWQFFYSFNIRYATGGLLSLIVPPLTLWIVVKYFAPSFNQKLSQLSAGNEEGIKKKRGSGSSFWALVKQKLAALSTGRGEERMSFLLTWDLTSRSKDFKLKVYPSFGYLLVYAVMLFFNNKITLEELRLGTSGSKLTVLSVTYICTFIVAMALEQIQYSDKFRASWFYYTTPIRKPGLILAGSLKATMIKFVAPACLVILIAGLAIIGVQVVPNLLLGFCNVWLSCLIIAVLTVRALPFSAFQHNKKKAGAIIRSLMSMLIPLFLGVLQFFVYHSVWAVLLCCCLSVIASWLLLDYLKNKSWQQLAVAYNE